MSFPFKQRSFSNLPNYFPLFYSFFFEFFFFRRLLSTDRTTRTKKATALGGVALARVFSTIKFFSHQKIMDSYYPGFVLLPIDNLCDFNFLDTQETITVETRIITTPTTANFRGGEENSKNPLKVDRC